MDNIIDYLDWRGDLTFEQDGLNEVDGLLFSILAYVAFDGIVDRRFDVPIPLRDAFRLPDAPCDAPFVHDGHPFLRQLPELLEKAARCRRFGSVELSGYANELDTEHSTQFSAITFSFAKDTHFMAFRGTDDTIAGWKEDFQMSFMDEVPAQRQAAAYLNEALSLKPGRFYLGGHSKGGNLAVFAGINAPRDTRDRILAIYSNDAPGFQTSVVSSEGYCAMLDKIHTYVPKSSMVGILLEHGEEYRVVSSAGASIFQHNPFLWEVRGTGFIYEEELTMTARSFDTALRSWLGKIPIDQRIQFVDALFEIIQSNGAQTVTDLSKEKLASIDGMIKTWIHMSPATRTLLRSTVSAFFTESQKVLRHTISSEIESLLARRNPGNPPT